MTISAVPQPVVTPVLNSDGTVPLNNQSSFILSFLVEVDQAVDVPVDVVAQWSGNTALSDSPRVMPGPAPTQKPYIVSLEFASLEPSDLGDYELSVELSLSSNEAVVSSEPVEVMVKLSLGESTGVL